MINVVAVAHGTDASEGREAINLLRESLSTTLNSFGARSNQQFHVFEAYVDVQEPRLETVLASLPTSEVCVVVPLLLSAGYHTQVDCERAAAASGIEDVRIAQALGPDRRLAHLQRKRLEEAGWTLSDTVVHASAGSSRPEGKEQMDTAAALLAAELSTVDQGITAQGVSTPDAPESSTRVVSSFVAAQSPSVSEAVEATGAGWVSSYLLIDGFFQSQLVKQAQEANPAVRCASALLNTSDRTAVHTIASCAFDRVLAAL